MKSLYNAINLQRLLTLRELGIRYVEPIAEFNESEIELPNILQELRQVVNSCHLCELSKSRNNTVFGEGNLNADLMFIGDFPGSNEDSTSRVFSGRAGELLTKMIENVLHISRDSVYIANILKCKPSATREVTAKEIVTCKPYLQKQIEIIKPKLVVALGEVAYNYLSNDNTSINRARGNIINLGSYNLMATYHPNYLLRNPSAKKETFDDLLKVKEFMQSL